MVLPHVQPARADLTLDGVHRHDRPHVSLTCSYRPWRFVFPDTCRPRGMLGPALLFG
jgi:hypothetical protein